MKNLKEQITCYTCPKKAKYFDSNSRLAYECPVRNWEKAEIDHYCGLHPEKNNGDTYQEISCCNNCAHIRKTIECRTLFFECIRDPGEKYHIEDGGHMICGNYKKDNGGIK